MGVRVEGNVETERDKQNDG